ncbi:hypothetical protein OUZ56_005676 [Daphnia magna]|uniref:Uncharacterized protein n=1 Tax=Daphnia magna TaxID=35525 RepID=A0ABQ9YTF3_9CRUS|nr:hypothetical protein OUZ56_005676 [Daphnia magna]
MSNNAEKKGGKSEKVVAVIVHQNGGSCSLQVKGEDFTFTHSLISVLHPFYCIQQRRLSTTSKVIIDTWLAAPNQHFGTQTACTKSSVSMAQISLLPLLLMLLLPLLALHYCHSFPFHEFISALHIASSASPFILNSTRLAGFYANKANTRVHFPHLTTRIFILVYVLRLFTARRLASRSPFIFSSKWLDSDYYYVSLLFFPFLRILSRFLLLSLPGGAHLVPLSSSIYSFSVSLCLSMAVFLFSIRMELVPPSRYQRCFRDTIDMNVDLLRSN